MKVNVDPVSFAPVHLIPHFDLQTYRELGLDIDRLADPSPEGLIYKLRVAAGYYIVSQQEGSERAKIKYGWGLSDAYDRVTSEMRDAEMGYQAAIEDVTVEHPAIQAYAERNPAALGNASTEGYSTSKTLLEDATARRHWLSLALVRPNDAAAVEGEPHPTYRMVEGAAVGITSGQEVAQQLLDARLGVARAFGI